MSLLFTRPWFLHVSRVRTSFLILLQSIIFRVQLSLMLYLDRCYIWFSGVYVFMVKQTCFHWSKIRDIQDMEVVKTCKLACVNQRKSLIITLKRGTGTQSFNVCKFSFVGVTSGVTNVLNQSLSWRGKNVLLCYLVCHRSKGNARPFHKPWVPVSKIEFASRMPPF